MNPGGLAPELSSTTQKVPLPQPDGCEPLVSSGKHVALGTGKGCTICKMSLFLMTDEIVRGVSVSSREQIILKGGSILTIGAWLALLTTEDPALVTQSGPPRPSGWQYLVTMKSSLQKGRKPAVGQPWTPSIILGSVTQSVNKLCARYILLGDVRSRSDPWAKVFPNWGWNGLAMEGRAGWG